MAQVTQESRRAQVRFALSLGVTATLLVFTLFGAAGHARYTPAALGFTGLGVFVSTWFLLDVWITARASREREQGSGGVTPMTGARRR
ncbi:hypothetical protein [Streptacidiphilus monticola]|jgi:hypothetical protein|uniref:Uncharacterized protein n=1 Tax=Streptacidiphilus monticola TaxID=2161674 RepID=A0ABW1GAG9_9ACTN